MALPSPAADPLHRVFLMPGSIHVATRPTLVTTILGSCIAVCLWDSLGRIGGMNHFVLPAKGSGDRSSRYGDVAIERLVGAMPAHGARIENLQAKLFGGAAVLRCGSTATTVGERNLQVALERLAHYGVPVVAQRTGGERGLLIRLNTETGEVTLRNVATALQDYPFRPARDPAPLLSGAAFSGNKRT